MVGQGIKKQKPNLKTISIKGKSDRITFSFDHLEDFSYTDAQRDGTFFITMLQRFSKLCTLGWTEIAKAQRHSFGFETMLVSSLSASAKSRMKRYPDIVKLFVFRATGDNHVFLGYREENVFNIIFIEHSFGDVYQH